MGRKIKFLVFTLVFFLAVTISNINPVNIYAQDTEGNVDSQSSGTDSVTSDTGYNWDDYTSGWGDNVDNLDSFVDAFNSVADSLGGDTSTDISDLGNTQGTDDVGGSSQTV